MMLETLKMYQLEKDQALRQTQWEETNGVLSQKSKLREDTVTKVTQKQFTANQNTAAEVKNDAEPQNRKSM